MSDCAQFAQTAQDKMSDREQIAQGSQDKWATVSNSLRSLMINKRMSDWLKNLKSYVLVPMFYIRFLFKKMSDSLIPFFLVSDVSELLKLLTKNERCETIAQVAHQNERPWAIRSGCSEEMSDGEGIAQVAHQKWANKWIANFF